MNNRTFKIGDIVHKPKGSWWQGRVVGFYSTEDTQEGYCVQLDIPHGPVQIYPASALSASAIGEDETYPVNNGGNSDG